MMKVFLRGIMDLAQMKRTESLASAAEDMPFLSIWAIVRTGPLREGTWGVLGEHDLSAGATASTGDVKIRGVGVGGEDHGAGLVEDAVVGVGGEVVEELTEVSLGELGGCGLCGSKVTKGKEELVVYCTTILQ